MYLSATALCVLGLLAIPGGALAQTRREPAEPPVHGLLASGGRSTLGASLVTFAGYDQSTISLTGTTDVIRQSRDGEYFGGTAALVFMRPIHRFSVQASGSSDLRYYPQRGDLRSLTARTGGGSLSIGGPLRRRGSLRLSQTLASSSFYQFNPFSGYAPRAVEELTLPSADFQIERGRTVSYDLSAGTDWRVGTRDLLAFDYSLRHVSLPGELVSILNNGGGFRYSHQASRAVSFVAGYGYQLATTTRADASGYHRIDLGAQYNGHPLTRRTTVSASTGAAVVAVRDATSRQVSQVATVVVNAALHHDVARSWNIGAEYRREPQTVDLYVNATYADSVFLSLRGQPSRRMNVSLVTGYSRSALDAGRGGRANDTFFGTTRAGWRITRALSMNVEYAYYGFDTAANRLAIGQRLQIDRQSVRCGLSWSIPLVTPGARR